MNVVLEGLASNPALPGFLLDRLVTRPELAWELASRNDLSSGHVRALLTHGDSAVVSELLSRGLARPENVPIPDESVALAVLEHPDADPALARVLAFHPDPAIRSRLPEWAHHLAPDVVDLLAADPDPEVVAGLVTFHAVPPALALSLSRHPSPDVRRALAASPHTPPAVLARLGSSAARELASNPSTPAALAAELVRHHEARYFLASRTDLPPAVYEQLASEIEPGILSALAVNPAVPVAVLRRLSGVLRNPAIPLDLLVELAPSARLGSAEVPPRIASASEAELRALADSSVTQVRLMVALRPDLPPDLVQRLARDPDPSVATAVAAHPSLTGARLRDLVSRCGARSYPRVALNPSCPADLLHHMALHAAWSGSTYRAIAGNPAALGETLVLCLEDARARHLAAAHPNLPVAVVVQMLGNEFTASAAAANPSLPVPVMEELVGGA
ncbi:hypothetical protein V1227_40230 [Lentzea sp. DG1S-22]|uniref:hypothetical protein n=1 Tax=Lentzea sp. DG1S-22 TaxID=3108822 RepID=UPI002E7A3359|nr:hypothetical protein [Lentzea sp. DG1S-22]WVH81134.1 hypothetical protein V1227_40230 [Lentzea sp. DG1S-22]